EGLALRDLLDPDALARTEAELQHLVEGRRARDADELTDLLRTLGPLTVAELAERAVEPQSVPGWVTALAEARRIFAWGERWVAIEDAGRFRDALGVALPPGVPHAFAEPVADPFADLLVRYGRTHAPFGTDAVGAWLGGLGSAIVLDGLRRLVADGRLVEGEFTPSATAHEFVDPGVLRTIRRRSVAALRAEVEPVPAEDYARFLPAWQAVGASLRGVDGVMRTVEQLAGVPVPASALEPLVLAARVRDYSPALLDELCAAGEVLWRGHGSLAGRDGWVSLWPADLAHLAPPPGDPEGDAQRALADALAGGGALFFAPLAQAAGLAPTAEASEALWELVWRGLATNDTLAPLRARLGGGPTTHRARTSTPRGRFGRPRLPRAPRLEVPRDVGGRWSLLPAPETDRTQALLTTAEVLLDRYGIVTRGAVQAEEVPGGFAGIYKVLTAAEDLGRVRRGYFVEGLGAAQFGTIGAIDRLRGVGSGGRSAAELGSQRPGDAESWQPGDSGERASGDPEDVGPSGHRRSTQTAGYLSTDWPTSGGSAGLGQRSRQPAVVLLAASDPANPYGAALPWPDSGDHRPGRKAGALVVLADGRLAAYIERGGRTALTWTDDEPTLATVATALSTLVRSGRLAALTVEKVDGNPALDGQHPFAAALLNAGFHQTPKGIRLRR
ncbi:MAG: DEAD/DEAH box helicase, partial [Propionibacteriaceae bacterium]|nr:DEAD/DEAH box helicase [Propionibacteriaceae bacterium]